MRCEDIHEIAADVALGIADGEDRAEALRHLAACGDCRRLVDRLSQVADELLLLAPEREPPVGFETRVVDALGLERAPRRRLPGRLRPRRLLAPVAAAAVTAAALVAVYHDDAVTADRYRDALALADGQSFHAAQIRDKTGARAGIAFGYQGSPSWLLVTIDPAYRAQVASGELVTRDGRTFPLRSLELRQGSWGSAIPLRLYDVATIRLLGDQPGEVLEASL